MIDLEFEKFFWKRKKFFVVGLDEAGRGAVAGPVVAGAVLVLPEVSKERKFLSQFFGLRDSKKLTAKKREKFFYLIKKNKKIFWAFARVKERTIEKINIAKATKIAMVKALNRLAKKIKKKEKKFKDLFSFNVLILDGKEKLDLPLFQYPLVKADEKVFSCALSSIVAKVKRDGIMKKYGLFYKNYGFEKHKGYLTKNHFQLIKKLGPCPIHRKTFYPINQI
ncbi:MAG: ribonuclease HII [Minisyncoccales bacterium]